MALGILASLAGTGLEYGLQNSLLERNAALNLEQWERENEYNSPKEQMRRLAEAGLNPDLVYGNINNAAAHADLTNGTPQAPHAASALTQSAQTALNEKLLESQVEKNEADSERARAEAKDASVTAEFKKSTMQVAMEQLTASLNFTNEQVKVAQETVVQLQASVDRILSESKYLQQLTDIGRYKEVEAFHNARSSAASADMMVRHAQFYDNEMRTLLDNWASDTGVNNATRDNIKAQTSFLWSTFQVRKNLLENQNTQEYWAAWLKNPSARYSAALADMQQAQLQYYPYMMAQAMFEAQNYFEHNKDGSVKTDKNGMPVINNAYALYKKNMGIAQDVFGLIESGTASFRNVGSGMFGFKFGAGSGLPTAGAPAASAPAPAPAAPAPAPAAPKSRYKQMNGNQKLYWNGLVAKWEKLNAKGDSKGAKEVAEKMWKFKREMIDSGVEPW